MSPPSLTRRGCPRLTPSGWPSPTSPSWGRSSTVTWSLSSILSRVWEESSGPRAASTGTRRTWPPDWPGSTGTTWASHLLGTPSLGQLGLAFLLQSEEVQLKMVYLIQEDANDHLVLKNADQPWFSLAVLPLGQLTFINALYQIRFKDLKKFEAFNLSFLVGSYSHYLNVC